LILLLLVVLLLAGLLDDFRVWTVARSEAQLKKNSQESLPTSKPSSLLINYDFDGPQTLQGDGLFDAEVLIAARDPTGDGPPTTAVVPNLGGGSSPSTR